MDTTPFRTAAELRWHPNTIFTPGEGGDGDLIATRPGADPITLVLDIYTPADMASDKATTPFTGDLGDLGVVVAEPATIEQAQDAIRGWCREQLGRDDVMFDPWPQATTR